MPIEATHPNRSKEIHEQNTPLALLILIAVLPTFSFGEESVTKHRIDVWLQQTLSKT